MYSGEGLFSDQTALLAKAFPNVVVRPLMYGSVDGGLIAIPTHDADLESRAGAPVYVPNSPNVVAEILREGGKPITNEEERGILHVTDLSRRLMPIIRYPTGDVAEWVDFSRKQFVLRGRDLIGFKIGPASYDFRHLREIVVKTLGSDNIQGFQTVARRKNGKDELVFWIAGFGTNRAEGYENLDKALKTHTTQYASGLAAGYINPLAVGWIDVKDLYHNPRTGKLRETVDQRF